MKKRLIVIDGLDGSGKTTQFDIVKEKLGEKYKWIALYKSLAYKYEDIWPHKRGITK